MRRFDRRDLLKGFALGAGATVLSPILRNLVGTAHGQATSVRQVVFVLAGNGFLTPMVPPSLADSRGRHPGGPDTSTLIEHRLTDLPVIAAPLERYRDRMLIVHDLTNGVGGGHYHMAAATTGMPNLRGDRPGGESVDHFIGRSIGGDTAFPLLALGAIGRPVSYFGSICARSRGEFVPIRTDVLAAFDAVFGAQSELGVQRARRTKRVMDLLRTDLRRVREGLASEERAKFDQYTFVLDQIDQRDQVLRGLRNDASCERPTLDADLTAVEARQAAMARLGAAALTCGMTRVLTLAFSTGPYFSPLYQRLGYTVDMHGLGHGGRDPVHGGDGRVHQWHAELIAGLCDTLASVPQGDGTMLDHTLIVWHNDNGTDHHARPWTCWSIVLIGGPRSPLKTNGTYVRYPSLNRAGHRHLADFHTTICHAAGAPVDHFAPDCPTPIEGPLEALFV